MKGYGNMGDINERLLDAWLSLSTSINNERLVSDMTYNESLICNLLYRNQINHPEKDLTATDLCNKTKMLKSQMNRTLNSLEEKKIVVRERSKIDKRKVFIKFNMEQANAYKNQHLKILKLVDTVIEKFGKEKAVEIVNIFNEISEIAEEVM